MVDYFGLHRLISIILVIFPLTAWILGVLTRCKEGKYIAAIIRIPFGNNILWICDLISCILNKCNVRIIRIIDC